MPQITSHGTFGPVEYVVRRANNLDVARTTVIKNRVASITIDRGMGEIVPGYMVEAYARMVVQGSGATRDGQKCYVRGFVDGDGVSWDMPPATADDETLYQGFMAFLNTDHELTDVVWDALQECDRSLGPDWFLPKEQNPPDDDESKKNAPQPKKASAASPDKSPDAN